MTPTPEALKPCPFCGGKAELWPACEEPLRLRAFVGCVEGCAAVSGDKGTSVEAIAAWNRRTQEGE